MMILRVHDFFKSNKIQQTYTTSLGGERKKKKVTKKIRAFLNGGLRFGHVTVCVPARNLCVKEALVQ